MRYYSSTATPTKLAAGIDGSATSIQVVAPSGYPAQQPFTVVLDPDTSLEEIVTVTNAVGTTWTVLRGQDGTSALSHSDGAVVQHKASARDFREPQEHIAASTNVHGVTSGSVVGTSQSQTVTNKTMSGASNTFSNIPKSAVTGLTTDLSGLGAADAALDARVDTLEETQYLLKYGNGESDGNLVSGNEAFGITYATDVDRGDWTFTSQHSGQFRVPAAGLYLITAQMAFSCPTNTSGSLSYRLRHSMTANDPDSGGVALNDSWDIVSGCSGGTLHIAMVRNFLAAGAQYGFSISNGTNQTVTILSGNTRTFFSLVRLTSP